MLNRATFLLARGKQSAMEFVETKELERQSEMVACYCYREGAN